MTDKWDGRFLEMARVVSTWSKDPSSCVGAIVVDEHRSMVAEGYNGFVRGADDDLEFLRDREYKYERTIHAEMNAIFAAGRTGVKLSGTTMYVFGLPVCHHCALGISQVGVRRVVVGFSRDKDLRQWADEWNVSRSIFTEAGVEFECVVVE
jgi:dCMP deaminase